MVKIVPLSIVHLCWYILLAKLVLLVWRVESFKVLACLLVVMMWSGPSGAGRINFERGMEGGRGAKNESSVIDINEYYVYEFE